MNSDAKTIDAEEIEEGKFEEKKPGFFKRHWKKFVIGGAIIGAAILAFLARGGGDSDEEDNESDDDESEDKAESESPEE